MSALLTPYPSFPRCLQNAFPTQTQNICEDVRVTFHRTTSCIIFKNQCGTKPNTKRKIKVFYEKKLSDVICRGNIGRPKLMYNVPTTDN